MNTNKTFLLCLIRVHSCSFVAKFSSSKSSPASDRGALTPPPPDPPGPALQNSVPPRPPGAPAPSAGYPAGRRTRHSAAPAPPWPLRPCQNPRTVLRHRNTMLEVRRVGPVLRHGRPLVLQHDRFRPAGIHHRLHRQHHARLQPRILVLPVHIIRNL